MTDTIEIQEPTSVEALISRLSEIRDIATRESNDFGHKVKVVGEGAEQARVIDRYDCEQCDSKYCRHQGGFDGLFEILALATIPETEKVMLVDEQALAVEEVWDAKERIEEAERRRKANL